MIRPLLSRRLLTSSALAVTFAFAAYPVAAQNTSGIDEAALVERLKAEIIKELRDSGAIREAVEAGIQDFVKQQQEARANAEAMRAQQANTKAKNVRRVSAQRDHIYGNPDAPLSLIEYSDFECPYCKRFHATPKQLVEQYAGKVNWVYRHFPLSFHNPGAQKQAEASECAAEQGGNDAFWKYTDALYARTKSGGKGFPLSKLVPLAEEIGLDGAAFKECLDSGRHEARVKEDFQEGGAVGVSGTPATILLLNATGEVRLKSGAQPIQAFKTEIDRMLATSKE
jgi:protein-disulfide isomerase